MFWSRIWGVTLGGKANQGQKGGEATTHEAWAQEMENQVDVDVQEEEPHANTIDEEPIEKEVKHYQSKTPY